MLIRNAIDKQFNATKYQKQKLTRLLGNNVNLVKSNNKNLYENKFKSGMGMSRIQYRFHEPGDKGIIIPSFLDNNKICSVIGAPMCAGQRKSGVDLGPKQLRDAGLIDNIKNLGWLVNDYGDLNFPSISKAKYQEPLIKSTTNTTADDNNDIEEYIPGRVPRNSTIVGNSLEVIYNSISHAHKQKSFVLTLGGDHSIGAATVLSVLSHRPQTGIIWVDAHADINTPETSNTGNLHGMPIALAMKLCDRESVPGMSWMKGKPILDPKQIVYIGLRDLDPGERRFIRNLGIKAFTMHEVDKYGIGEVMRQTFKHLSLPNGEIRPLHLSYDIDACDPAIAPATGTLVRGGFSFREAHYIAEAAASTGCLGSMDLVEVNASLMPKTYEENESADMTVQLGVALISSAMGSRIL